MEEKPIIRVVFHLQDAHDMAHLVSSITTTVDRLGISPIFKDTLKKDLRCLSGLCQKGKQIMVARSER